MNLINDNSKDQETTYIFSKAHNEIYISAYKMFLDNKVFGVGVKNFRNICHDPKYYVKDKKICTTHPHNTYIQILVRDRNYWLFVFNICFNLFLKMF